MKQFVILAISSALMLQPVSALACGAQVYGAKLSGFKTMGIERTEFDSIADIFDFHGLKQGRGEENSTTILDTTKDPKRRYEYLLIATETGTPDDSISARQWQFGVNKKGDVFVLKTAGERWKCARAKDPQKWTTKKCP
jgi:hypothetical protein